MGRKCLFDNPLTTLSDIQVSDLKDFLKAPDITITFPGRNNQMYIGKKDGQSIFVSKHFLFYTLRELHAITQQSSNPNLSCIKLQPSTVFYKMSLSSNMLRSLNSKDANALNVKTSNLGVNG